MDRRQRRWKRLQRWRQAWRERRPLLIQEQAARKLIRLARETQGDELMLLISASAREQRVLELLEDGAECVVPDDGTIPWNILWVAALYNGKYRHTL